MKTCRNLVASVLAVLALAGCASTRLSEADRLALYMAHAGEPVSKIRYADAMGWDRIDDEHVVLEMRPNETWLLHLSGPCLDLSRGSPVMALSSQGGWVVSRFDRVLIRDSPISCVIDEIRRLDMKALREAQRAMRDQASGT